MIIKDVEYGDDHKLTKAYLTETIGHATGYPWRASLTAIKKAHKNGSCSIRVYGKRSDGVPNSALVDFDTRARKIGCRYFSPATFAKILKAAGVKKARKSTKKGK